MGEPEVLKPTDEPVDPTDTFATRSWVRDQLAVVAKVQSELDARPKIHAAMVKVFRSIGAIGKDRKNEQQRYNFRGIDDMYNELHDHLADAGVYVIPMVLDERSEERQNKSGGVLIYRVLKVMYTFYAEDGSHISCTMIGEGMDSGDKAANKAMSAAQKYAFLQVFCIPTEEAKDSENDSHEVAPRGGQQAPVERYNPKNDDHKRMLAKMCQAWGIKDAETMAKISGVMAQRGGCPMDKLGGAVKAEIDAIKGEGK